MGSVVGSVVGSSVVSRTVVAGWVASTLVASVFQPQPARSSIRTSISAKIRFIGFILSSIPVGNFQKTASYASSAVSSTRMSSMFLPME